MRHKRKIIVFSVIVSFAAAALAVAYAKVAAYYQIHFLPNTYINGMDCSDMEAETVIALLDAPIEDYVLEVIGRDYRTGDSEAILGRVVSNDIQLKYADTREMVYSFLEQQEASKWIQGYGHKVYTYSFGQEVTFDETLLTNMVKSWDAFQKKNMLKAEDAYISEYSEVNNSYEVIPETIGTEFDADQVAQCIADAVKNQEALMNVEAAGCYKEASVGHDDKVLTDAVETVNTWLAADITYDWNGVEVIVDSEILREWISLENNIPILNEEAVAEFVKRQAAAYDTYGKKRNFITALGVELTLPSGYYGWKTDTEAEIEELIQLIGQGAVVQREPVYSSMAQKKGSNDIGSSYVEADLTHQHLYLYHKGTLVLETDFVSGDMSSKPGNVTPEGVFGVAYKTVNAVLRGEDYITPVSYWMPYFGNYGMHDATWRSEFGGDIYIANGSHGCINLPLDKAAQIYQYVYAGFPVICYYYQVDPLAGQETESQENEENYNEDDSEDEADE